MTTTARSRETRIIWRLDLITKTFVMTNAAVDFTVVGYIFEYATELKKQN